MRIELILFKWFVPVVFLDGVSVGDGLSTVIVSAVKLQPCVKYKGVGAVLVLMQL